MESGEHCLPHVAKKRKKKTIFSGVFHLMMPKTGSR